MNLFKSFTCKQPYLIPLYHIYAVLKKSPKFFSDFRKFKSLTKNKRFSLNWEDRYPCLEDNTKFTGFDRHYVYHTAWGARILAKTNPPEHTDFSSLIYFASLVSAFVPTRFYDFRPAQVDLPNLKVGQANLLQLPMANNSLPSMSCMHVIEHIGLGRYGDQLDPNGDLKAIAELKRVLAKGGQLLFVVPIGKPKIMFNAHRIYSHEQILNYFKELTLIEFTLISGESNGGGLLVNPKTTLIEQEEYACGCFWFRKD